MPPSSSRPATRATVGDEARGGGGRANPRGSLPAGRPDSEQAASAGPSPPVRGLARGFPPPVPPSQTLTDVYRPHGQKNGAIGDGSPMRRDRAGPEASQRFRPEAVLRPLQRGCCVLPVGRPSPTVPTSSHLPPSVRSDRIPVATVRQMPRVRYAVVCDRTAGERSGAAHRNQRFVRHLREALLDQRSGCAARLVPSGGSATLHFSLRRDRHEGQAEKRIPHRH